MSETMNYTGAVVFETIASTGLYEITAVGGTGGGSSGGGYDGGFSEFPSSAPGGAGASAKGTFLLHAGDLLEIAVGGAGGTGVGGPDAGIGAGGGGGGSFVILETSGTTYSPLLIAGGGGGAGFNVNGFDNYATPGEDAQAGTDGGAGDATVNYFPQAGAGAEGGTDGSGGGGTEDAGFGGAGGGGYYSDGESGGGGGAGIGFDNNTPPSNDYPNPSFTGGVASNGGVGGFGGGAGGGQAGRYPGTSGGGGGGYSGGGGGFGEGGGGGGSYDAGLNQTIFAASNTAGNGSVLIQEVTCFLGGTHILTTKGEITVETLTIGDEVVLADGSVKPVRWLGRNTVATRFADPLRFAPIRIRAGALGSGLPLRDLLVSPDHAIFVDGALIHAAALVNGRSIVREANMPESFVYYHVELDSHALILAEGAMTESFVDNVDRMAFDNWAEHDGLYGDATIIELDLPRAKAARQVPQATRRYLLTVAETLTAELSRAA